MSNVAKVLAKIAADRLGALPPEQPVEAAPAEGVAPELEEIVAQQGPQNAEIPVEPTGEAADPGAGQPGEMVESPVLGMLIGAYCAEVEAAFQYEWARISCLGKARNYLESECDAHRKEEWEHAEWLAERIDTLGGTVPFTLAQIHEQNPTPGDPEQENNRDTAILAQQILDAEQAAVDLYTKIEAATADNDPVTNDLVIKILETEQNHVADFTKILMTIGAE